MLSILVSVNLPLEIARMVLKCTGEWPMGLAEAELARKEIEKGHNLATKAAKHLYGTWGFV